MEELNNVKVSTAFEYFYGTDEYEMLMDRIEMQEAENVEREENYQLSKEYGVTSW